MTTITHMIAWADDDDELHVPVPAAAASGDAGSVAHASIETLRTKPLQPERLRFFSLGDESYEGRYHWLRHAWACDRSRIARRRPRRGGRDDDASHEFAQRAGCSRERRGAAVRKAVRRARRPTFDRSFAGRHAGGRIDGGGRERERTAPLERSARRSRFARCPTRRPKRAPR